MKLIPKKKYIITPHNTNIILNTPTLVLALPDTLSISPSKEDSKELFSEPTVPTTATNCPDKIRKFMLDNVGASVGFPQVNVPFSITIGSSTHN